VKKRRVSDPHPFHADPDPRLEIIADPDPEFETFADPISGLDIFQKLCFYVKKVEEER